jgi:hypothetical protein
MEVWQTLEAETAQEIYDTAECQCMLEGGFKLVIDLKIEVDSRPRRAYNSTTLKQTT